MKLRNKLLALLIVLSLLPLITFSEILSQKSVEEIKSKTENGIMNLVKAKAIDYDKELEQFRIYVESLSSYISKKWGENGSFNISLAKKYAWISPYGNDYEKHKDALKNLKMLLDAFSIISSKDARISLVYFSTSDGILFVDREGAIINLSKLGYFNTLGRPWYVAAKEKNGTTWSKVYIDANTGEPVTTISTPVYKNGKFLGVVALDILLKTIRSDVLDIRFENEGHAMLIRRDGMIIVCSGGGNGSLASQNILNVSGLNELYKNITKGEDGIRKINYDGISYAVYYPIKEINGSLVFLLPEKVITKPIQEMQKLFHAVILLIAFVIVVISIAFSRDITKPLEKLKKATNEIAKGNLEYKVEVSSQDEIGELARNFNYMVERLKNLTKSLEESEKKYRGIFENSIDAVYISNEKGKLLDINKAGEELFGYTKKELLSMNVENLYANRKDRERFKQEIKKKGYVKNFEVKLRRKDGKEINCLLSTVMFRRGDEIIYQGIIKDITPLIEARKEIDVYNSLLRHDISNRLQIALGITELIKDEIEKEELKELVEKAFDNLVAIRNLLLKLRMISKAYEIELKKIDLNKAIKESIDYFDDIAKERGIKIHYEETKGDVKADEMLVNIFSNIIENAINHGKCKNIYIDVKKKGDEYIVEIKNDGVRIPKKIMDKIFEMGVKGNESTGSGLGLHLVKKIVEKYEGRIEVESGKETIFRIYLKEA